MTGTLRKLMTKKSMATCAATAVRAGALPRVLKACLFMDCLPAHKSTITSLASCVHSASTTLLCKQLGYRYMAVELKAVIRAVRGKQRADVVMDLTEVPPAQLLAAIAELAGLLIQEIQFVWASVPC